jgi:hypothetical protein
MRFAELDIFGVYVAPIAPLMALAWLIMIAARRLAARADLLRHVWHPALFVFALYIIILSTLVMLAAEGIF